MNDEREGLPSASSAERFVRCPGSVALIRQVIPKAPQISDGTADEGTLIHHALETDSYDKLTPEQADIADGIKQQRDALVESFKFRNPNITELREERMWLMSAGEKIFSAKPDIVLLSSGSALVCNYKTGYKSATPAHLSWQSRAEALAVWQEFRAAMNLKEIIVAVAQFRFKGQMSVSKYTETDLNYAIGQLQAALWAAAQPDAQRVPGYWCDFCPANLYCPERKAWCLLPSVLADQGPLSLADLSLIERRRLHIEKLLKGVTNELRAFSDTELAAVGLVLKENSPRREIASVPKLAEILEKNSLCDKELLMEKAGISIGDVSALVKEKVKARLQAQGLKGTGKEIAASIAELIAPVVEAKEVSKSVVEVE